MAAYLFGCFFQFLMNRMLIFVHQFPFHIFGQRTVRIQVFMVGNNIRIYLFGAQAIFLHRIFAGISVSADQLIHPAIRAWRHYVMLDEYCLTVFRANDSSCLVTVLEIFYFFARGFPDICRSVNRLCIHSHQCLHPVSPMNIE